MRDDPAAVYEGKVKGRVMRLDNQPSKKQQQGEPKAKQKPPRRLTKMSNNEARRRGLYDLQDGTLSYADCLPLNELWSQYAEQLMHERLPITERGSRLAAADLHGAFVRVDKARVPSYIGLDGIIVQETEQTIRLMCQDSRLRTVVKGQVVLSVVVLGVKYFLHGPQLAYRPSVRSKVKFKPTTKGLGLGWL
ncbi:unnamed protein product [Vitrella brassicaformis CCMP3155]|uniref:Uncharacterized protein n=1 Tax=Vitrella brassicaformis (strain CCMP3155) TaxID=1169540 RepID=A0A0G4FAB5_VITBC|nr:unnamed protein product [Vitrella brassicaformis CCMP3155]|eukprot:CEM09871.1 unnamed protein product [Vitrella brassicaformis CCMP3155]